MPKPPKKPIIYSPTFAIRAFAVMLQHCEHTELLTDFSKMGEAIIKHHDSYIWVTVEQELVGFFFIFSPIGVMRCIDDNNRYKNSINHPKHAIIHLFFGDSKNEPKECKKSVENQKSNTANHKH